MSNSEIALPNFNQCPQGLKGLMVTEPVEVLIPNTQAKMPLLK